MKRFDDINFQMISNIEDYESITFSEGITYDIHLHGLPPSLVNNTTDIVATLDALLDKPPEVKHDIIMQIAKKFIIVFVGYSAFDTDLFPIFAERGREWDIYWVDPFDINSKVSTILNNHENRYIKLASDDFFEAVSEFLSIETRKLNYCNSDVDTISFFRKELKKIDHIKCAYILICRIMSPRILSLMSLFALQFVLSLDLYSQDLLSIRCHFYP